MYTHLRCQKHLRKHYGFHDRQGRSPNQKPIEERPAIFERRSRIGDLELDTIIGNGPCDVPASMVKRKSRLMLQ